MTKVDIFSGFLGAGKTTLIKKLLDEAYKGEKVVLIENEFGEIGIDGGFLKEAGVEITEMNSGCICCSLVGDFSEALKSVIEEFAPDRILIEPSGVGKLSDVIKAVRDINSDEIILNSFTAVADVKKCKMYMKNFGEFYNDQIENAGCIILSHTTGLEQGKIETCVELIRSKNENAVIVTTPWEDVNGKKILEAMEGNRSLKSELEALEEEHEICPECGGHHHHHHSEDCDCGCHAHEHHHHHDEECECHEHHHDHDTVHEHCHDEARHEHHHHHKDCDCGCHNHEHEHGECCHHEHEHHHHDDECCCGHHHHEHGHHHADDVFASWGMETSAKYSTDQIKNALSELENQEKYGMILRAKGIVAGNDGSWIHFDYVPGEADVRTGGAEVIGRLCVIGADLNKEAVEELFSAK